MFIILIYLLYYIFYININFILQECKPLDPDLTGIMAKSRNYTELRYVWKQWRENVGKEVNQFMDNNYLFILLLLIIFIRKFFN